MVTEKCNRPSITTRPRIEYMYDGYYNNYFNTRTFKINYNNEELYMASKVVSVAEFIAANIAPVIVRVAE